MQTYQDDIGVTKGNRHCTKQNNLDHDIGT